MKMLYIDCSMGAAGDMLSSALLELFPDREETLKKLNSLGLQGVEYSAESVKRCGVSGTRLTVKYLGHEEGAGRRPIWAGQKISLPRCTDFPRRRP